MEDKDRYGEGGDNEEEQVLQKRCTHIRNLPVEHDCVFPRAMKEIGLHQLSRGQPKQHMGRKRRRRRRGGGLHVKPSEGPGLPPLCRPRSCVGTAPASSSSPVLIQSRGSMVSVTGMDSRKLVLWTREEERRPSSRGSCGPRPPRRHAEAQTLIPLRLRESHRDQPPRSDCPHSPPRERREGCWESEEGSERELDEESQKWGDVLWGEEEALWGEEEALWGEEEALWGERGSGRREADMLPEDRSLSEDLKA
ncbi:hypothetical protein F7725_001256 [Dissostichus mawsoni]|uniref:Uncharacterized protein n=1 Tax=Dissostichus mawsoni TaxID=36200 RepID=A0A7J5ZIT1_DISMA|nr:hypothetical protein F7725_001256 [Dissostichus mawsoni]